MSRPAYVEPVTFPGTSQPFEELRYGPSFEIEPQLGMPAFDYSHFSTYCMVMFLLNRGMKKINKRK
jgi:hypothetical protein